MATVKTPMKEEEKAKPGNVKVITEIGDEKDSIKTLCIEFNGWLFEGYEDLIEYRKNLEFL